ncbi:DNA helicase [Xanthomonas phage JGB6]|nr:DNA helicase [Xanthomonas phage JGB6]
MLMGPAKSGKSMAMVTFAMKAAQAGYNVLYVSLEVSKNIIADRMEAALSGIKINDLSVHMKKAHDMTVIAEAKAGHLKVHDYASGTFTPNQLRRLLRRYEAMGIKFDMVVLDYADLMAPDKVSNEPRENSRMIYVNLRGVAHEFNLALLTATQANRAGFKAATGDMEHVSDDINKVRTVDLMISSTATKQIRTMVKPDFTLQPRVTSSLRRSRSRQILDQVVTSNRLFRWWHDQIQQRSPRQLGHGVRPR